MNSVEWFKFISFDIICLIILRFLYLKVKKNKAKSMFQNKEESMFGVITQMRMVAMLIITAMCTLKIFYEVFKLIANKYNTNSLGFDFEQLVLKRNVMKLLNNATAKNEHIKIDSSNNSDFW